MKGDDDVIVNETGDILCEHCGRVVGCYVEDGGGPPVAVWDMESIPPFLGEGPFCSGKCLKAHQSERN
jgi:hypothetical protein